MTSNLTDSPSTQTARSRYPGARPFSDTPDDRARFFGRDKEGEELYLRVLSVPLVVQFGKSGLGKTSLLQASLFPRLRQKPFLPVMVRFNVISDTPTLAVARCIRQACENEKLEFAEGRKDGLWELLSTSTVWRDDLLLTFVLIFDQFEEVFNLRDRAFRVELAAELGAIFTGAIPERLRGGTSDARRPLGVRPGAKVVISVREDYLGALEEFSSAIPGLFHERLRLEPFREDEARDAINRPAQLISQAGEEPYWSSCFEFEPSALDSMIAYLKGSSGVIEPFQLQLLCRHAEAIAQAKGTTQSDLITLTSADFAGSKGFDSVLTNFYRDTLLKLDRSQRRRAEELCEEGLLDNSGHRLMLEEGQIHREFRIGANTLTTLAQERLLRRERRMESAFFEISHDRLAESILRSKRFRLPKRARRVLWTALVVAPVLLGILVWRAGELKREKQSIDALLSFHLGDFLEEVRDIGRSTMLTEVDDKVRKMGDVRQLTVLNKGLALRNRAELERIHGSLAESIALLQQALVAFESSHDDPAGLGELARTHDSMGEALADQGQVTQALSHYGDAVKLWRQVVANTSRLTTEDNTSLADTLVSFAELRNRAGETPIALANLEEALRITSDALFQNQMSPGEHNTISDEAEPYPNAKALAVFSHATLLRATILYSPEDYEGATALAIEARKLNPTSMSARKDALDALAWRGNGRLYSPQLALNDYREVLAGFEELRRWDPNNRLWQRERAAIQLLVAEGIVACNASKTARCNPMPSLEEAEAINLEAIATLRALVSSDPTNASWKKDLVWALQDNGKVLGAAGRQPERLASLEKAEKILGTGQPDKADTDGMESLGSLLIDKSDALAALGRTVEARQCAQQATGLFSGLSAAHQDNPAYLAYLSAARKGEAKILQKSGDTTAAEAANRESAQLDQKYQSLASTENEKANKFNEQLNTHVSQGSKLFEQGDYTKALSEFKAAESAGREFVSRRPANPTGYGNLRYVYQKIDSTNEKLGFGKQRTMPLNAAMHAAQIAALLETDGNKRTEANKNLLYARHNFGLFLYNNNRLDDALAMVQEEISVAQRLVQEERKNADLLWRLGNAMCGLGMLRREKGKTPGWEEAIRSGLILIQKAVEVDAKEMSYLDEVGDWRKYLGDQLGADGRKDEASPEYQTALRAYREVLRLSPGDQKAKEGITYLSEHHVQ